MDELATLDYERFFDILEKLIDERINKKIIDVGIEVSAYGEIHSIDKTRNDTEGNISKVLRASVKLASGEIVNNIFNATGEILNVGDTVKIYGSKENMANRYIGIKYEGEVVSYAEQTN